MHEPWFRLYLIPVDLLNLGWNEKLEAAFAPYAAEGMIPGRVAVGHGSSCVAWTNGGELKANVAGRLRLEGAPDSLSGLPAVGDWIAIRPPTAPGAAALVYALLPRRTAFIRKTAGLRTKEQVVAANIDFVFIVSSLNNDFNPHRIERYVLLARESGAQPVVILSKTDLPGDKMERFLSETQAVAPGIPIHQISAVTGAGIEGVKAYFNNCSTIAMLGSSGVGKSTLINALLGEERLRTAEIRKDDRGRHTTTYRELMVLPGGGLVIDTPGMRELQMWEGSEGLAESFEDIELLAQECRFGNCLHSTEPDCAVLAAIAEGKLTLERLESFRVLQQEVRHAEVRKTDLSRLEKKRTGKVPCRVPRHTKKR